MSFFPNTIQSYNPLAYELKYRLIPHFKHLKMLNKILTIKQKKKIITDLDRKRMILSQKSKAHKTNKRFKIWGKYNIKISPT